VRRSRYGAIDVRQESAACWRSAGVNATCISFSASAKVAGVTSGPEPGPVPNVGGAPAVVGVCVLVGERALRHAVVATSTPSGALIKNCLLVFIGSGDYPRNANRGKLHSLKGFPASIPESWRPE
jgi:nitrate reductase gamma subunit